MKLIFCLFNYFPFGGLQRDFIRIARECLNRGHSVDVVTMRWEGEIEPGLNVTCLPVSALQNHTRCREFVKRLRPILKEKKYDAVVGFNKIPELDIYYAADTCYEAKVRAQRGAFYRLLPRYRHLAAYEKAVFEKNSKTEILLISKQQQTEFSRFYDTPEERFHLLPPGISRDRIAPDNAADIRQKTRAEFGLNETDYLLLAVGSGFKTKGLDRTLDALASLPSELKNRTHLFVIGQDNALPFMRQAKQSGLRKRVHFLGGRHDVPDFLLAADLLLHPAYNENTGTVLLEALAAGLPVLTTDVCGYAHYIEDANAGIVLPSPFHQAVLNRTLENALSSLSEEYWQKNALEFAKKADIYSLPERATDIIEQLCS